MAQLIAPEDGDIILHYYLPSGALLELQVYFKKGELADRVLQRAINCEGLPGSILPDLLSMLGELFLYERRFPVVRQVLPEVREDENVVRCDNDWQGYSRLFETPRLVNEIKQKEQLLADISKLSVENRIEQLENQDQKYNSELQMVLSGNPEPEALTQIELRHLSSKQKIDSEFTSIQQQLKVDFWDFISSQVSPILFPLNDPQGLQNQVQPAQPQMKTYPFYQEIEIKIGSIEKRTFVIAIALTSDLCDVPRSAVKISNTKRCMSIDKGASASDRASSVSDSNEDSVLQILHPDNVYRKTISCLVLPYLYIDNTIEITPDLIRICEQTPELHFPSIRDQLLQSEAESKPPSPLIFTRHSNLPIEGAFHILNSNLVSVKELIPYANVHGVQQLIFPYAEWCESKDSGSESEGEEAKVEGGKLIKTIKAGLWECLNGDLEEICVLLDSADYDLSESREIVKEIGGCFAETISGIR